MPATCHADIGSFRFRIVAFNDFHGSFREKNNSVGAAKFVAALDAYRRDYLQNYPTAVGVFCSGDNFSGTALSYYSLFEGRTSREGKNDPLDYLFFRTGVVCIGIGNHEFDWGGIFLKDHLARTTVRVVERSFKAFSSSNILEDGTNAPPAGIPSFDLIEIEGTEFRVAVISLTTRETPQKTTSGATEGFTFLRPAFAAERLMKYLKGEVDAFLFMAHASSYQDENGNVSFGREQEDMQELVRLKPLAILSAHSHRFVSGSVDGVPIVQAGCYANGMASIDFIIDHATKKAVLERQEVVDLRSRREELPVDPDMERAVAVAEAACDFKKVGVVRVEMPTDRRRLTDLGVLIGKAFSTEFREWTKDEPVLAFQHSGGIRSGFSQGEITEEDCYDMLPFQGGMDLCRLPGENLLRLMREGFVNPVGYLQSFGLTFYYDRPDMPKEQFHSATFRFRGKELLIEPDKLYWVVLDDFIVQGGDDYPKELFEKHVIARLGPCSRDILARFCRDDLKGDVHIEEGDRLRFVSGSPVQASPEKRTCSF